MVAVCYDDTMFICKRKSSRNDHIYVQIVESYRHQGSTRQRMIKHVGTAKTEDELNQLIQVANVLKVELEHQQKTALVKKDKSLIAINHDEMVPIAALRECSRQVLGIHDIYGEVYDQLGFTNLFTRPKQQVRSASILRELVLGRIAEPGSKRATVERLASHFGVSLKLEQVYRTMDKMDHVFSERIQKKTLEATYRLTGEQLDVVFYDATTLYFESFSEDELKQNGFSKDKKFNQPQVLLTLLVTTHGLPVGYEVFPGAMFEGHTMSEVLTKLKQRYAVRDVVVVADRGMLNASNIEYLEKAGYYYILGSKIKTLKQAVKKEILTWSHIVKEEAEGTHRIAIKENRALILSYRLSRAKKDRLDREKAVDKLKKRLSRSANPKELISQSHLPKYIRVEGNAKLVFDEEKLQDQAAWDGLVGMETNHPDLDNLTVINQYSGLWQVEESFRIQKHDLRIRPIYHWTPRRVKAHIAISFMAFSCIRHVEYRLAMQGKKLSPEVIKKHLLQVQASIIEDTESKRRYRLVSKLTPEAKSIYSMIGVKQPQGISEIIK